jgi:hypothetical protein
MPGAVSLAETTFALDLFVPVTDKTSWLVESFHNVSENVVAQLTLTSWQIPAWRKLSFVCLLPF